MFFIALQCYLIALIDFSGVRNFPDKSYVTLSTLFTIYASASFVASKCVQEGLEDEVEQRGVRETTRRKRVMQLCLHNLHVCTVHQ